MTRASRLIARARGFLRGQDGSITVDFVLVLPVFLTILLSSFEAGYATVRIVMMERALDIAVRDLRVGALGATPTHDQVRARICDQATLMTACMTDMMLEMNVISRATWTGFTTPARCVDRTVNIQPALNAPDFIQGGANELVTIRACAVFDPYFPTTRWGLRLTLDDSGGYQLAATSAFVNEPR